MCFDDEMACSLYTISGNDVLCANLGYVLCVKTKTNKNKIMH